jgi:hypothetical protein
MHTAYKLTTIVLRKEFFNTLFLFFSYMSKKELVLFGELDASGDINKFIKPTLEWIINEIPDAETFEKELLRGSEYALRAPGSSAYYKKQVKLLENKEVSFWEYYFTGYQDSVNIYMHYTKTDAGLNAKMYVYSRDLILSYMRTIDGVNKRLNEAVSAHVEAMYDFGFDQVNTKKKTLKEKEQVKSLIVEINDEEIKEVGEGSLVIE